MSILQEEKEREYLLQEASLRPGAAVLPPPASTSRRVMAGILGLVIVILMFYYVSRVFQRARAQTCLLYTSPSPRDGATSRMPSSA